MDTKSGFDSCDTVSDVKTLTTSLLKNYILTTDNKLIGRRDYGHVRNPGN